jgi:hypothetical protein
MEVTWRAEGVVHRGWWRQDDNAVLALVTDPPGDPPVIALAREVAT